MSYHVYPPTAGAGSVQDGQNLGTGASVFAGKVGTDLTFKTIVAGSGILISEDSNEIILNALGGGGGSGDVIGPASATNNALVRYDGTSGKLIKNSGVLLDNSNNLSGINNLTLTGTTTLASSLTGVLKASSGVVSSGLVVDADIDPAAAISVSKLQQLPAFSILGRAGGTTGPVGIINAVDDNRVLSRVSGFVSFNNISDAMVLPNTFALNKLQNSPALSLPARVANSTGALTSLSATVDGQVVRRNGTALEFGLLQNINIDNAAAIAVSKLAAGSNGQILQTISGVPTWANSTALSYQTSQTNTAVQIITPNTRVDIITTASIPAGDYIVIVKCDGYVEKFPTGSISLNDISGEFAIKIADSSNFPLGIDGSLCISGAPASLIVNDPLGSTIIQQTSMSLQFDLNSWAGGTLKLIGTFNNFSIPFDYADFRYSHILVIRK